MGQGDLERQSLLRRLQGETMHPEGLWRATTVLKPSESGKGICLPRRHGDTLENRNTDVEDLEVSLEIARGCADRHVALKVALLESKPIQMWRIRDRRLVVISAENALSEEEVGVIIAMSTYFVRIPGLDLCANCIERMNQDMDWGEIGKPHLRVLVYPRGHPIEVKELMPYPIWSMEATRSPTWLESLAAYAYEMEKEILKLFVLL